MQGLMSRWPGSGCRYYGHQSTTTTASSSCKTTTSPPAVMPTGKRSAFLVGRGPGVQGTAPPAASISIAAVPAISSFHLANSQPRHHHADRQAKICSGVERRRSRPLRPTRPSAAAAYSSSSELDASPPSGDAAEQQGGAIIGRLRAWQAVTLIMCDTFGSGLLLWPAAYGKMGFMGGTAAVVVMSSILCYLWMLLAKFKTEILPTVSSYGDAARFVGGERVAVAVRAFIELAWWMLMMVSFLTAREALNDVLLRLAGSGLLEHINVVGRASQSLLIALFLAPLVQIRTLSGVSWLGLAATIGLGVAIFLALGDLLMMPSGGAIGAHAAAAVAQASVPPDWLPATVLRLKDTLVSPLLTTFLMFMAHSTAFEVINDMADTRQLPSVAAISFGLTAVLALVGGAVVLATVGPMTQPYLIAYITDPFVAGLANALIGFKAMYGYVFHSNLLVAKWVSRTSQAVVPNRPLSGQASTTAGRGSYWGLYACAFLAFSFFVSCIMDSMNTMANLLTATVGIFGTCALPALFFVLGKRKLKQEISPFHSAMTLFLIYVMSPVLIVAGLASVGINVAMAN